MRNLVTLCFAICQFLQINGQEVEYDVKAWQQAADYLTGDIDQSVDPCNNVYDHVCGNYKDPTQGEYQRFSLTRASETIRVLEKAILNINLNDKKLPQHQRFIRTYYDKCTSQKIDSKQMTEQMYRAIASRFGEFPLFGKQQDKLDVWRYLGSLLRHAAVGLGFGAQVTTPEDFPISFGNVTADFPFMIFAQRPLETEFNATQTKQIIRLMAKGIGKKVDEGQLDDLVNRMEALYNDLQNASIPQPQPLGGNMYTLSQINDFHPYINNYLDGYLDTKIRKAWSEKSDPEGNVAFLFGQDWVKQFKEIIDNQNHKPDAWQALGFLAVRTSLWKEYYDSDSTVVAFNPVETSEYCIEFISKIMGSGAARAYFDYVKEDPGRWRAELQLMGRNIFSAWRFMLNSIDWIDLEDKVKLNQKLDVIKFYPGLPDWIEDDDKVVEYMSTYDDKKSLYENELEAITKGNDKGAEQLITGTNPDDPPPTFELNSRYEPGRKRVRMYLGFGMPPYYQPTYPLAVKYGGFGFAVGHELGHAFDSEGTYAPASPDKPWLKPSTLKEFEKRKDCIMKQYNQYCFKFGLCIGNETAGDNLADINGMKAAYLAYKYVSRIVGGDIPMPQLLRYTSDQIFFLSVTRQWCSSNEPTLLHFLRDTEHSPDRPRMEIALRNVPQFGYAFHCPKGSPAYASVSCPIWGDYGNITSETGEAKATKRTTTTAPDQGDTNQ